MYKYKYKYKYTGNVRDEKASMISQRIPPILGPILPNAGRANFVVNGELGFDLRPNQYVSNIGPKPDWITHLTVWPEVMVILYDSPNFQGKSMQLIGPTGAYVSSLIWKCGAWRIDPTGKKPPVCTKFTSWLDKIRSIKVLQT
jgi:hypothetical protein